MIRKPMFMFNYFMTGLHIASEIRLPELQAGDSAYVNPDIQISIGPTPTEIPGSQRPILEAAIVFNEVLLTIPEVARYHIKNGSHIVIDPAPNAADADIRSYLLGSAMGAIYFQKGLFPLHASVVVVNEKAIAFCGDSGEGKSTMAAWLNSQGYPLMCDDVCVIGLRGSSEAVVYPSHPHIRLWKDTLEAFSIDHADLQSDFFLSDKYHLPVNNRFRKDSAVLSHIFVLAFSEDGSEARLEPIAAPQSVAYLHANTYRYQYINSMGLTEQHFIDCVELANRVKFKKIVRPKNYEAMAHSQQLIERELM